MLWFVPRTFSCFKAAEGEDGRKPKIPKVYFHTRIDSWDRVTKIGVCAPGCTCKHKSISCGQVKCACKTPLKSEMKFQNVFCLLS